MTRQRHERLEDFSIESDLRDVRTWFVHGAALERFAQMTNFDFYEASLRFQRSLQAVGLWDELERRGVEDGDVVVIGNIDFTWSGDRSESALYEAWMQGVNAAGKQGKGSARWPHMSG